MADQDMSVLTLPSLKCSMKYNPIPRRYEETKPAIIQDFSHRRILELGHQLQRRSFQEAELKEQLAVEEAQAAVVAEAERQRGLAVEAAYQQAAKDHEKAVKKLVKSHEKNIKEEILRVENRMQKVIRQQVHEERQEAQKQLEQTVKEVKQECHQQLLQAVEDTRQQQMQLAAQEAQRVAREEKTKLESAMVEAEVKKIAALDELSKTKEEELKKAVARAHQVEQQVAKQRLSDMRDTYEEQVQLLKDHIESKNDFIQELQNEIRSIETTKRKVMRELLETRAEFQNFVDKTSPYVKGQAGFVIPSLRSFDIE